MADAPDGIVVSRDRDLRGREHDHWIRRTLLALVGLIPLLALFNLFGQRPQTSKATGPVATMSVYAPTRLRGGLLWEGRFHIKANQDIKKAILVLGGWAEGMSINTIEPSPVGEASANGKLEFTLGHIPKDKSFILYMQFQVNPTNVAWRRHRTTDLFDGSTRLASVRQRVTIFP